MKTQRTIRRTLLALALVALGTNGTALAQPAPETLLSTSGMINNDSGTPSVDVYSLQVNEGDTVTVDISTLDFSELDTVLSVVDHRGVQRNDLEILRQNDPSSTNQFGLDAYAQFTVKTGEAGDWQVSVTANPFGGFGPYDLLVTRVPGSTSPQLPPELLTIRIDIKPNDSHKVTPIKPGERYIRVALLSDREKGFDPFAIKVDSLRFGATGSEQSLIRCATRGKDRNGDRKADRVCRFDVAKTGLTLVKSTGMVKGMTTGNKAFQGGADVRMIPPKHYKDRKHHDDDDDD
jgi:hypothetical protein